MQWTIITTYIQVKNNDCLLILSTSRTHSIAQSLVHCKMIFGKVLRDNLFILKRAETITYTSAPQGRSQGITLEMLTNVIG